MKASSTPPRYVIVSPVKDEERYVEYTLKSVTRQTLKPSLWMIVDDGSSDRTSEIIRQYVANETFIQLTKKSKSGPRQTGSAVMQAFNYGYKLIDMESYDYIVKLDCDLSFETDYFEKLFQKFLEDEKLGIASGIYLEKSVGGEWREVNMPSYHAAGACKVLRRECFDDIDGFVVAAGWDTVDEIRAMSRGWTTTHFKELKMWHHKLEGSGIGTTKTNLMHGEIYYYTGGGWLFLALKVIHRMGAKPYIVGGLVLLCGYLKSAFGQKKPLVTKEESKCYRSLLANRMWTHARNLLARF
jgi:poly-beta-1,6-N-acetyl-D-glucosamine synthase